MFVNRPYTYIIHNTADGWVMSSRTCVVRCSSWRRENTLAGTLGPTVTAVTISCLSDQFEWWVNIASRDINIMRQLLKRFVKDSNNMHNSFFVPRTHKTIRSVYTTALILMAVKWKFAMRMSPVYGVLASRTK